MAIPLHHKHFLFEQSFENATKMRPYSARSIHNGTELPTRAKIKRVVFRMSMRGLTDDADCPIPFYVQCRYTWIEKCVYRQSLAIFQCCACVVHRLDTDRTQAHEKRTKLCSKLTFTHLLFSGFCTHATAVKFHLNLTFLCAAAAIVCVRMCVHVRSAIQFQL